MQLFALQQKIQRFREALETETDPALIDLVRTGMLAEQRELALLSASTAGVRIGPPPSSTMLEDADAMGAYLKAEFERSGEAWMLLDAGPGLTIIDINPAFEKISLQVRDDVVGRSLFDVFPDNPQEPGADGVSNLYSSLKFASETAKPHAMAVQRYDIQDETGAWLERWWRPVNIPIFDLQMRLAFLLQQVVQVEKP